MGSMEMCDFRGVLLYVLSHCRTELPGSTLPNHVIMTVMRLRALWIQRSQSCNLDYDGADSYIS